MDALGGQAMCTRQHKITSHLNILIVASMLPFLATKYRFIVFALQKAASALSSEVRSRSASLTDSMVSILASQVI